MSRAAFSWNAFKQHYDGVVGERRRRHPGRSAPGQGRSLQRQPDADRPQLADRHDYVAAQSGGSSRATFYTTPTWQIYANALVQLPWRLELSGAVFGRQGQIRPQYIRASAGLDGAFNVLARRARRALLGRLGPGLRLARTVKLGGSAAMTLSAEAFNVLNSGTTLQVFRQVNSGSFQRIDEILSPRIVRFGARFTF
ncbi:MAG: hypothetical protein U0599_30240 [Vicinamibacteria bacterium]